MIFKGMKLKTFTVKFKTMNSEEKDFSKTNNQEPADSIVDAAEGQTKSDPFEITEDDLVRNDTIPETSKDTPGSNGAFPVGAFDTSKD